jgi:hypothetical protein
MSTRLKTKMKSHTMQEYWGGVVKGACVQITAKSPLRVHDTLAKQIQEEGFIQLTLKEATALRDAPNNWILTLKKKLYDYG